MQIRNNGKNKSKLGIVIFVLLLIVVSLVGAKENIRQLFDKAIKPSKAELKEVIKDLIIEDPEFIIDALKQAQVKEMEKIKEEISKKIVENKEKIENSDLTPSYGDKDSLISMVYFFDYKCGYCKKANDIINSIIAKNKDIRIIYKELPILGRESYELARAALAVYSIDPSKYREFHDALFSIKSPDNSSLKKILSSLAISYSDFEQAMKNPKIEEELDKINNLSAQIGISGTPVFIINDMMIPGADQYVIERRIQQIRKDNNSENNAEVKSGE